MHANIERESDEIDRLVARKPSWKVFRILSWMKRFINSCCKGSYQGPLTTNERVESMSFLIKRAQSDVNCTEILKRDSEKFNLERNNEGIFICKSRIQEYYPIYLPFR